MKKRIFSDRETEIINTYLQSETRLEGFRMLLSRCKKFLPRFEEDLTLLKKFLEKVG